MRIRLSVLLLMMLGLSACASSLSVPDHMLAPEQFPSASNATRPDDYRIGPLDELNITVFQEPDLSVKEAPVDASGNILLPLIGQVRAEGRTSRELSTEIAARFSERYLVNPQVSVIVSKAVALKVTVDGQVRKPGVYDIEGGRTTLLQAVARAEGTTEIAATRNVIVFRQTDGKRYAARFDLKEIWSGQIADPQILGGDVVIVGTSTAKGLYQDLLKTAPLLGPLFVVLAN